MGVTAKLAPTDTINWPPEAIALAPRPNIQWPPNLRILTEQNSSNNFDEKADGTFKRAAGKLTDDQQTESEGQAQRSKAEIKDKVQGANESVKGTVQGLKRDN